MCKFAARIAPQGKTTIGSVHRRQQAPRLVRIHHKLLVIIVLYSTLLVGLMFALMRWSVDHGMIEYINTKEIDLLQPIAAELANLYGEQGNWQPLKGNQQRLQRLIRQSGEKSSSENRSINKQPFDRFRERRPPRLLHGLTVLDQQEDTVTGPLNINTIKENIGDFNRVAIAYRDEPIGWLVTPKRKKITDGFELKFLQQQKQTFIFISLIVIALAAMIAYPLARHFVRPVNRLAAGTLALTRGEYTLELPEDRSDELGQLARDFNELAKTLDSNETTRKRWLADISHELRTPLSILRGELEAIIDGVRPTSQNSIISLHEEIMQLQHLIDDLYQLSNSDIGGLRYNKTSIDLSSLIRKVTELHRQKIEGSGLSLIINTPTTPLNIWGDQTRLNQLFDNLLDNSQKYTDHGGKIAVTATYVNNTALVTISDSSPGVPNESLAHLFDHLYRVDDSRNRNTGGSGLGLAICQQIVNVHNATIAASQSPLGGLTIEIIFPIDTVHTQR